MNIMLFSLLLYSGTFSAATFDIGDGDTLHLVHWCCGSLLRRCGVAGRPFSSLCVARSALVRLSTDTL